MSLMGCVPVPVTDYVYQPFEPHLNWSRFSVHIPEKRIPKAHEVLGNITVEQYEQLQVELRCAAQHLFWSSIHGGIMNETGAYDAFETLMEVLRVKTLHPDLSPTEYEHVDEDFARFMRCQGAPEALAYTTTGYVEDKLKVFKSREGVVVKQHLVQIHHGNARDSDDDGDYQEEDYEDEVEDVLLGGRSRSGNSSGSTAGNGGGNKGNEDDEGERERVHPDQRLDAEDDSEGSAVSATTTTTTTTTTVAKVAPGAAATVSQTTMVTKITKPYTGRLKSELVLQKRVIEVAPNTPQLCSFATFKSNQRPCKICMGKVHDKYLYPGGALCCGADNLAQCRRLWE